MAVKPKAHMVLEGRVGSRALLLGNEAIARGALEAGVDYVAVYPGTPSTEIGDTLYSLAEAAGLTFEYAINEKVALETAGAAAMSGLRSLTSMKHVGLNVAADAFVSLTYTGVRGALVVVTADDPGCHSSQNEQDNRHYARLANVPMLEPSTPQQALEMTREAFRMSESLETPVLLRTTTRVSHARGPVVLGPRLAPPPARGRFERAQDRFILTPTGARRNHRLLLERMQKALALSEASPFNRVEELGPSPSHGVIASGVAVSHARDVLDGGPYAFLQLGFTHPLPKGKIAKFIRRFDQVTVVEELEPYLEEAVRAVAQESGLSTIIRGKADGLFPLSGELNPDLVTDGFAALGWVNTRPRLANAEGGAVVPLPRPPVLCPGCGHRATAYAFKKAARRQDLIVQTDIGCYILTSAQPLGIGDTHLCMGASISTASGIAMSTGQRAIALIGDSTFFHAGIPALINAVHHGHDIVVAILDNNAAAMTGHQPHPGVEYDAKNQVPLEDIVRGCGVQSIRVVDPYEVKATVEAFKEALREGEVSVIISRHPCRLLENREILRERGSLPLYAVDEDECTKCGHCIDAFGCPALLALGDGGVAIDPDLCSGCGVCADICPPNAIVEVGREET